MEKLTTHEQKQLTSLEAIIERGKQTYIEVGQALMRIRDERLYRQCYSTFELYCQSRWGFTRHAAHDYIIAVEVAANIVETTQQTPSLSQAAALASLPADQQREVAAQTDFAKETVKDVKRKVQEKQGKKPVVDSGAVPKPVEKKKVVAPYPDYRTLLVGMLAEFRTHRYETKYVAKMCAAVEKELAAAQELIEEVRARGGGLSEANAAALIAEAQALVGKHDNEAIFQKCCEMLDTVAKGAA